MPTVLVIDDDSVVRSLLVRALSGAHYTVIEAADGLEGLALARSHPVDLVITDLIMPVQEGVETIMVLRKERPRLPIIAISGGVTHSKLYLGIAEKIGAQRILAKPFTPKELLSAVEQVLADVPLRGAPDAPK